MQRAKRGAKAWYDVDTDQVYFVAPNATSIQDAEESILNVDSIIFVWLLITSPTLTNEEMRNDGFYSFLSNSIIKGLQNPILNFEFQNSPISRYELNKSHQQLNFHRKLLTLLLDWPSGWYE